MKRLLTISFLLLLTITCQAQFHYSDFSDLAGLVLRGTAQPVGSALRLTPPQSGHFAGVATVATKQRVDADWSTTFTVLITNPGGLGDLFGRYGGDGFALVIQNSDSMAIGTTGGGIGYDGIPNSLAVEFDTYANGELWLFDPTSSHVSVQTRGRLPNTAAAGYSRGWAQLPELADSVMHTVTVRYCLPGRLTVIFDQRTVLDVAIRLDTLLGLDTGRAWLSITAGSQNAWEDHLLLDWSFRHGCCEPDTVRLVDTLWQLDTVVVYDTTRVVDTLLLRDTLTVRDTVRRVDTIIGHDTTRLTDTIVRVDTVRLHDTILVERIDTVHHYDTTIAHDTICPPTGLEEICGGQYREMTLIEFPNGIVSIEPNPARDVVTIVYELPNAGEYRLDLVDINGHVVETIVATEKGEGRYRVAKDLAGIPSGTYLVLLRTTYGVSYQWLKVEK